MRRPASLAAGLALAGALVPGTARPQQSPPRVSLVFRGETALQRHEMGAAVEAFRAAARDTNAVRRAAAERMLALIQWRYYRDFDGGRTHILRALSTGADGAVTLLEASRLARAQGKYREAYQLARQAHDATLGDFTQRLTVLALADAATEPVLVQRVDGATVPAADLPDSNAAREAVDALRELVRITPGRPEESYELLMAGLAASDGVAALEGLRSYFLIGADAERSGPLRAAIEQLGTLLPDWPGDASASALRGRTAAAFARAGLFDAAVLTGRATPEVAAYAAYCRRLRREAEEYYRRSLVEPPHFEQLVRAYSRSSRDLWARLDWPNGAPAYFPAAVAPELGRRFGAVVQLGVTGGFYDLHFGHIVGEETRTINQYGRRARLHFVILDGMVSNGLQSWAWDDAGGHGGWQRRDTIVEVRPVFVTHTLALWQSADPSRREHERETIAADSAGDWTLAGEDSIAYLPGVAARLRRDGRDEVIDSLRRAGLQDRALADAFVATVTQLVRSSSIFAHEGRHGIDDQLSPPLSAEEREFRAKLSEVAFAAWPKLVLSAIVHPNIGDATPHGRANARVMLGLVRWMRAHAREIPGLDTKRPILPQLPLLTDQQLRRAFRSMDPLARAARIPVD